MSALASIAFVLFGLVLAVVGGRGALRVIRLRRSFVRVETECLDKREESQGQGQVAYYATLQWRDPLGFIRQHEFRVTRGQYWDEPDGIGLLIDPNEPDFVAVDRPMNRSPWAFLGALALGVIVAWAGLRQLVIALS